MIVSNVAELDLEYLNGTFNAMNICLLNISKNNIKRLIGSSFEFSSQEELKKLFSRNCIGKVELTKQIYHLIKNLQKVSGFLGSADKPTPISDDEIKPLASIEILVPSLTPPNILLVATGKEYAELVA